MRTTRTRAAALAVSAVMGLTAVATAAPSSADTGAKTSAAASADAIFKSLPKNWKANRAAFVAKTGVEAGPVTRQILAQLAGEKCEATALDEYVNRITRGIPQDRLAVLAQLGVFDYPTYDALIYGERGNPDYALTPGTTGKVRQTAGTARAFWDIKSGDIQVMGMDSEMVVDRDRVIRIIQTLFGATPAQAAEVADYVIALVKDTAQLRGGDNPIFTLNAFAFTAEGQDGLEGISDRIIMGEGIIKALRDTGNIEVGPQMVFSHEFGHHIQFENDAYPATTSPANTRRMELMADAYGTYLDVHNKGLNFNAQRTAGAVEVAHLVGDCQVTSDGHHGTPAQRAAAATWGANLAKKSGNTILPSKKIEQMFLKALPQILAAG